MIRVMLLDDHPVVRAGLRAIINAFPDMTVVAEGADGSPALTATRDDVDVIVSDIQMPGLDGISTTRLVKAGGGPNVLILTTYDTQADIISAIEAGALGYLLKDAPEQQLHDAIVNTAAGRRTLSPDVAAALARRLSSPELSQRESEILRALATGASNRAIAEELFISQATVKTHLVHIYTKLGVDNRTAAVAAARKKGLL